MNKVSVGASATGLIECAPVDPGNGLIGWLVDVALLVSHAGSMSTVSRIAVATGSLLLLAALRFVFLAYSRIVELH